MLIRAGIGGERFIAMATASLECQDRSERLAHLISSSGKRWSEKFLQGNWFSTSARTIKHASGCHISTLGPKAIMRSITGQSRMIILRLDLICWKLHDTKTGFGKKLVCRRSEEALPRDL